MRTSILIFCINIFFFNILFCNSIEISSVNNNNSLNIKDFTVQKPFISKNNKRHKTWVASFAYGNKFLVNQNALTLQASRFGFKKIINYDENDIVELKKKYPNIFKYKRGYGLWVWKPYVILRTLEKMKHGEFLIYLDSGTFINSDLNELFNIFNDKNIDIIISTQDWCQTIPDLGKYTKIDQPLRCTNGNFTKKSFLKAMNLDNSEYRNKFQIGSNLMILRNTTYTKKIMQKWLFLCSNEAFNKPCWKMDMQNSELECSNFDKSNDDFFMHLEDQAMLAAILYKEQKSGNSKKIKEILCSEYVDYYYEGFKSKKSSFIAHVRLHDQDTLVDIINNTIENK